jgi:hypothetical protein
MFSLGLQTHISSSKQVDCTSEFYKLRKPMGSDEQQLSDAKMPPYYLFKKIGNGKEYK